MSEAVLTLEQVVHARSNDYSEYEDAYRLITGGELVSDPYRSVHYPVPALTSTASIIIPAYNAQKTLEQCLIALEQSTFNLRYQGQMEVIVVDDGSTDETWDLLERQQRYLHLKLIQQDKHGAAHARNTAVAFAEGDIIICCDADMILPPFCLEELMKRHHLLKHVLLIGFRGDIDESDSRLRPEALTASLPQMLPPFASDMRLSYPAAGWPTSIRYTQHLKRLGKGKQLFLPDGLARDVTSAVWSMLCSLRRSDLLSIGGFDERFRGWGQEDVLVGTLAFALGNYIVPIYAAAGWHVAHASRSPNKARELEENTRLYERILKEPYQIGQENWIAHARRRVRRYLVRRPVPRSISGVDPSWSKILDDWLIDPSCRGAYLFSLGRYAEAATAFSEVQGSSEEMVSARLQEARALRESRQYQQAVSLLKEILPSSAESAEPSLEMALSLAAQGQFTEGQEWLSHAAEINPAHPLLRFVLQDSPEPHLKRAALYASQGDYDLAVRDYEAALLLDPRNYSIHDKRARALEMLTPANQVEKTA
jgi:glycosyltransferase involved in cell wall biosynthesis